MDSNVPFRDKESVEFFLKHLVQRENLGFVLFGDTKPGCFASISLTHKSPQVGFKIDNPKEVQRKLRRGWYAWQYYLGRSQGSNVIVCSEYESMNGGLYLQMFIIDKDRLLLTLEKYRDDFSEVLGNSFSPDVFLSKLERKKKLRPLLKRDHKLLGLVLGFDLDSCTAFRDRFEGKEVASPMKMVHSKIKGSSIIPVSFAGDPEAKETRLLIDAYRKETPLIEDILSSNDFLVKTIEHLKRESSKCSL